MSCPAQWINFKLATNGVILANDPANAASVPKYRNIILQTSLTSAPPAGTTVRVDVIRSVTFPTTVSSTIFAVSGGIVLFNSNNWNTPQYTIFALDPSVRTNNALTQLSQTDYYTLRVTARVVSGTVGCFAGTTPVMSSANITVIPASTGFVSAACVFSVPTGLGCWYSDFPTR